MKNVMLLGFGKDVAQSKMNSPSLLEALRFR
jgi:hypothetical protein